MRRTRKTCRPGRWVAALSLATAAITFACAGGSSPRRANPTPTPTPTPSPTPSVRPDPWPMFHRDERHTGVASGAGSVSQAGGPSVRWTYRVIETPAAHDYAFLRWYSSFPLGDLDGDGTLEVVVTSPDMTDAARAGAFTPRIIALKDAPGDASGVRALWTWSPAAGHAEWSGFDQYSAALADADGDGLLDVVFTSKAGAVRALKGTNGVLLWEHQTGHFIEAGPMLADLEGDGSTEVVVVTDCSPGPDCTQQVAPSESDGALFVFSAIRASGSGTANPPLWEADLGSKLDSAEPAIADLDPSDGEGRKAIVIGSWAGRLIVVWRRADGAVVTNDLDIRTLDEPDAWRADVPSAARLFDRPRHGGATPAIRSSPLIADFGGGPAAVFGWVPDPGTGMVGRISAVRLAADTKAGTVQFTKLWTVVRPDWKSSVALLPRAGGGAPWVVTGYGIGTTSGTGNYGLCEEEALRAGGGIVALDSAGSVAWENASSTEGNVRGSPAVADIDGDGRLEVLLTYGCYGKIVAYDGETGAIEWGFQLGPRTIGTPSVGDLDGNGTLEIVVPSYDGNVWALGGMR